MIRKILLAVSGTGHTEEMLNALIDLPCIAQAQVTVLHVVTPQASAQEMVAKQAEGVEILKNALAKIHLCRNGDTTGCLKPEQVTTMLREGDPKDVVPRVADELDVDLLIMGSRGLGRLRAILENSVSQYVFQLASRPMLLVKDDTYVERIQRILVAYDGSPAAKQTLELAMFLLQDLKGGELVLADINPRLEGVTLEELAQRPEASPILAEAIQKIRQRGLKYRCVVREGNPGVQICQIAQEVGADLVMLGSPDRRPTIARSLVDLDRLLGNSVSDYVRVHADAPVLLVRSPAST
ncbi:MAG: universal stress protein [Gloeomargarita sp. SKYG116]|nr:universal stress protein [Gloeomargarita sp. SKYG116]MCS7226877.1 universal stress protein [Gloeomargarita sp. SKYB31]MDW8402061.1 universal stress protein [Gloeomargarita sp. SKYGB_i_bin116]